MKLRQINEKIGADTVGHAALDVAGLAPGVGEVADLINAIWYARKEDYVSSVFSLISMIPEMGDLIGKGAKYLGKSSKLVARLLERYGDDVAKHWPKVVRVIRKIEEFEPYIRELNKVVEDIKSKREEQESPESTEITARDQLRDIAHQTPMAEWAMLKSRDWKEGYKKGRAGAPLQGPLGGSPRIVSDDFRKGWTAGYRKYLEAKTNPSVFY